MKCPSCQKEIDDNSKFCTKCGCNIAEEAAKALKTSEMLETSEPLQTSEMAGGKTCIKCGAVLTPGAKFCIKCGTSNAQPAPREDEELIEVDKEPDKELPGNDDVKQNKKQNWFANIGMQWKGKKAGRGLIIAAVVLTLLAAVSGIASYMVRKETISLPGLTVGSTKDKDADSEEGSDETAGGDTESDTALMPEASDLSELFAPADTLLEDGRNKITVDAELISGMDDIRSAINQYAEIAQEAGDASAAADRIADGYASYVSAVIRHKDIMNGAELSGNIYSQIMMEMSEAEKLADEMSDKGYTIDTSTLMSAKEEFKKSYTERVIQKCTEFITRDTGVSRTELWNLMSGFDGMFDSSDLDDPLRLRYAYALSWWIQKQIETELANGVITEKGAAIKIANMIEAMDYNPMMIDYYITYMKNSKEDCASVATAYKEIIDHLYNTQGIRVGTDIPLKRFWYFNDFGAYSLDNSNGVTPENRAWIRNRMSSVVFVQ